METLLETLPFLDKFGIGVLIPVACLLFVGVLAQWSLYDKCGLPGIACIVPVWNVTTFLKIMGRPAWQGAYVMIPPLAILAFLFIDNAIVSYSLASLTFLGWAYFMVIVYIELCQCFGHYKKSDYLMVVLLNGFYVLHLGLSYSEKYKGPVYSMKKAKKEEAQMEGQLA